MNANVYTAIYHPVITVKIGKQVVIVSAVITICGWILFTRKMNALQLKDTTMAPEKRTLLRVTLDDADKAEYETAH